MLGGSVAAQWALGAAAFIAELAMVVVVGLVAFRLLRPRGMGWAVAAATLAVLIFGAIWAMWFSPNADHRLPLWPRIAGCCVIILTTAFGLARTGSPRAAGAFALLGCVVMVIASPVLEDWSPAA